MRNTEKNWVFPNSPDDHPGYLGARRTAKEQEWTEQFGKDGWRFRWQTKEGRILDFPEVFQVYVDGYVQYFEQHRDEAEFLVKNFSFGYDYDMINKQQAFDPFALYDRPGVRNQFHNVAFNIAVERVTRKEFEGTEPIQVRDAKPGTPIEERPAGWKWSPGYIPCVDQSIIPSVELDGEQWWENGSVEDFYQRAKVLQVRRDSNILQ